MPAQVIANGIVVGLMYSLMAAGISIIFSQEKFINLFHGGLYIVSGYVAYELISIRHYPVLIACVLSLIFVIVFNAIVVKVCQPQTQGDNRIRAHAFILSLILMLCVQNTILLIFDAQPKGFKLVSHSKITIGSVSFSAQELFIMISVLIIFACLYIVMFKTRLGLKMRAVGIDSKLAELRGINSRRMIFYSSIMGALCAGIAGILMTAQQNIDPSSGISFALKAMAATIIGGYAIQGALYGGLILGMCETMAVWWFPSGYRDLVTFGIIAILLISRRGGLFVIRKREDLLA
jgi:branched-subunit amino acid ABC-type transport system permease component